MIKRGVSASSFAVVGSELFFPGRDATSGNELWKTDGTVGGTSLVADIEPGVGSSSPVRLSSLGTTLVFWATQAGDLGLWSSQGTAPTTISIAPCGGFCLPPRGLGVLSGELFYPFDDGTIGAWVFPVFNGKQACGQQAFSHR